MQRLDCERQGVAVKEKISEDQRLHWERTYHENPSMYGSSASEPGAYAIDLFSRLGLKTVLELGSGQGRDTVPMLEAGLDLTALDYSDEGLRELRLRATRFEHQLGVVKHDVHEPLPFPDESFDACYSHMLFNMALSTEELISLTQETRRVLRPGGVLVYTARHTGDAHYGVGADFGDNRFENGGFVVHFFDRDLVDRLADGFELDDVTPFNEGELPRKLFRVTMTRSPIT